MKLAITVHGCAWNSESAHAAAQFCEAAINRGHDIVRVFFYHDGALAGDALAVTPQGEASNLDQWVALHEQHGVELAVCIAAALKRGILNEEERERYGKAAASLHPAFQIVGLGQLTDAVIEADRTVTFAA